MLASCRERPWNEARNATSTGVGRTRVDEPALRCAEAAWLEPSKAGDRTDAWRTSGVVMGVTGLS